MNSDVLLHDILVIGSDFSTNLQRGSTDLNRVLKLGTISPEQLHFELVEITTSIGRALDQFNFELKQFALEEISVKLELSATGKIGILGTGVSATGSGGIELKFVRVKRGIEASMEGST